MLGALGGRIEREGHSRLSAGKLRGGRATTQKGLMKIHLPQGAPETPRNQSPVTVISASIALIFGLAAQRALILASAAASSLFAAA